MAATSRSSSRYGLRPQPRPTQKFQSQTAPKSQTKGKKGKKSSKKPSWKPKIKGGPSENDSRAGSEHGSPPGSPNNDPSTGPYNVRSGRIAKRWTTNFKGRPSRGFRAGGNSCYRNAVLQCLLHLPEFHEYMSNAHGKCEAASSSTSGSPNCVACAVKQLVDVYWSDDSTSLRTELNAVAQAAKANPPSHPDLNRELQSDGQSDPYNFLTYLIDQLQGGEGENDRHKILDLTAISHETMWKCGDCGEEHRRKEEEGEQGHGVGLSVDIQMPEAGRSMLKYLRVNKYKETRDINCDSAGCIEKFASTDGCKPRDWITFVTKAPEVLVIKLLRFAQDQVTYEPKKLSYDVPFEEYLNLGEFTESEDPIMYKLMGVVAHLGKTTSGGHFIAAVRESNGRTFCTINDELIADRQGATVEELEYPRSNRQKFDPYILFYSKL